MKRLTVCALAAIAGVALTLAMAACGLTGPPLTGDPAAGAAIWDAVCSRCHSIAFVKPLADLITLDMGILNPAMKGIFLTDVDIDDLKAFLATV